MTMGLSPPKMKILSCESGGTPLSRINNLKCICMVKFKELKVSVHTLFTPKDARETSWNELFRKSLRRCITFLHVLGIFEPQNIEQGISNYEVFFKLSLAVLTLFTNMEIN